MCEHRPSRSRRTFAATLATLFATLLLSVMPAAATDYLVMPGDVLQLDVMGMNGMQYPMPVGLDGTIPVPLAGPLLVAGRNIHDIRALVQARLASKTLRQSASSGEEYLVIIDAERVLVSIAEYRPVYLSGDVVRPGEQDYRPGMTVRQAISLAGGYNSGGAGDRSSTSLLLDAADFRAERARLWTEFTHEMMRIARIRSEIAGADSPPPFAVEGTPLTQETIDELARLQTELFNINHATRLKEQAFVNGELQNTRAQLSTIKEQQQKEREGLEADNAELQRHKNMESRGLTTSSRVADSRRDLLMSSTRYLQATVQIAQFDRDEAALLRRQQVEEDTRRRELLDELQQAIVRVTTIKEQVAAVTEKLRHAGMNNTALREETAEPPIVTVIRNDKAGPERLSADQDMPLMPGDVVEVTLPIAKTGLGRLLQN